MNSLNFETVLNVINDLFSERNKSITVNYQKGEELVQVDMGGQKSVASFNMMDLLFERLPKRYRKKIGEEVQSLQHLDEYEYASLIIDEIEEELQKVHQDKLEVLDASCIFPMVVDLQHTANDKIRPFMFYYQIIPGEESSHSIAFYHLHNQNPEKLGTMITNDDLHLLDSEGLSQENVMGQAMRNTLSHFMSLPEPVISKSIKDMEIFKIAVFKNTQDMNVTGIFPFPTLVNRFLNVTEYCVDFIDLNHVMVIYSDYPVEFEYDERLMVGIKEIQKFVYGELREREILKKKKKENQRIYLFSDRRPPELMML